MRSKWAITVAIVLLLFIGIHYITAEILSQRIHQVMDEELTGDRAVTVTLDDVSVHPFSGNISFSNVNLERSSPSSHFQLETLSTDLTYGQLWSVFLQSPATVIESLELIRLSGRQLKLTNTSHVLTSTDASMKIQPLADDQISGSGKESPFAKFTRRASIDLEMNQITLDATRQTSSPLVDSLASSPYRLEKLKAIAEWDGQRQTLELKNLNLSSPRFTGEGAGIFSLSNGFTSPRTTSMDFALSYSKSFTFNLGPERGEFTGTNLKWRRQKSVDNNSHILKALISGEHILTLDQFKWTPSEEVRNQLKAYTGGIVPANNAIQGDSLKLEYHFDTQTRTLVVPDLSYDTPNYSVMARGTITITPQRLRQSYIRNAEIKIYNLSDDLISSLRQIEDMFGLQLINSADESIRLRLKGKLHEPEWELL